MKAPDDPMEVAKAVWDLYYANHQKKGSLKHLKVADIFMGGGTTVVEGSRLGMQMFGNDLNPVAWFVVKNELAQVVQDAAESWSDALHFLDSAYVSAADSPYEDPERVRAIFEAMARVARHRRDGTLGTSLRDAFGDLGIDYRAAIARSTSARLREQYRFLYRDGELVEAEEHIVLGNTYDPRRCLRIYFSSRVPNEPRFVIAHVGRHFEVKSSS